MREQFHEELDGLSEQMVEMTRLVGSAVSRATTALLDADLALAEGVIAADEQIDALQIDLESLLEGDVDDPDVVIRPIPTNRPGVTTWPLSRPTGSTASVKMRLAPRRRPSEPQVHPGHDWFYVLVGRIRLTLGDRTIVVEAGEAAEFSTMTPHAIDALDAPAELIMVFDRDGQRAHLHTDA